MLLKSLIHPEGTSQVSDWGIRMVVDEKIYLEAYINKEYICLKSNTAQLV